MTFNFTKYNKHSRFTFKSKALGKIYAQFLSSSALDKLVKKLELKPSKFARLAATLICSKEHWDDENRKYLNDKESKQLSKKELGKFSKKLIQKNLFLKGKNDGSEKNNCKFLKSTIEKYSKKRIEEIKQMMNLSNGSHFAELTNIYKPDNLTTLVQETQDRIGNNFSALEHIRKEQERLFKGASSASEILNELSENNLAEMARNSLSGFDALEQAQTSAEIINNLREDNLYEITRNSLYGFDSLKNKLTPTEFLSDLANDNTNEIAKGALLGIKALENAQIASMGINDLIAGNTSQLVREALSGFDALEKVQAGFESQLTSLMTNDISTILSNIGVNDDYLTSAGLHFSKTDYIKESYTEVKQSSQEGHLNNLLEPLSLEVNELSKVIYDLKNQIEQLNKSNNPSNKEKALTILKMFIWGLILEYLIKVTVLILTPQQEIIHRNNYILNVQPIINNYQSLSDLLKNLPESLKMEFLQDCRAVDVEIDSSANLRADQTRESEKVATLTRGTLLEVIDDDGSGWLYVEAYINKEKKIGYIKKSLTLSFDLPADGDC